MHIAICDDSNSDSAHLAGLLEDYSTVRGVQHTAMIFSSPAALLDAWANGARFDCYLLDILMGSENGMDLARELRRLGEKAPLLFLTSSPDYALSAFSVRATSYLLKPVTHSAFFEALDNAAEEATRRRPRQPRHFTFRTPAGLHTTPTSDIIYVEIMGHTPSFHLTGGVVLGSAMRVSFEESVAPLIDSTAFLRPHRSFLVNAAHVVSVTPKNLQLDTGTLIPVARTRAAEVRASYLDYLTAEDRRQ